jgi:hypothetical protein
MTAILRLDAGRHPDDTRTAELVGELSMKSEHFRRWWADHKVLDRSFGTKRFRHPVVGPLSIDYQAFTMPGIDDQTFFVYLPTDDQSSQDAWRLLASWAADPLPRPAADQAAADPVDPAHAPRSTS